MVKSVTKIEGYLDLYKNRLKLPKETGREYSYPYYRKKGIYFLMNSNEVVYIGMSNYSIHSRVNKHRQTKKFDNVFFIDLKNSNYLDICEYVYINIFNPKYNKVHKNFEYSEYLNDFINL
tara:strand:+ start:279 stop:638 length:360 start_codon:yes stop_codon:yes gene_type:complete